LIDPAAIDIALPRTDVAGTAFRPAQSYWSESWERLRANRVGMGAGGLVLLMVAIAAAAPLLATYVVHHNPYSIDLYATFSPPGGAHWLGTDEVGRDTMIRLVYGAQVTLTVAFLSVTVALLVGGTVGLIAGFYGGWIDNVLMRFVDILLAIPAIYLLILLTILQPKIGPVQLSTSDPRSLAVIIAIVSWGGLSRLVRGEVLTIKNRDFMLAARSIGASDLRLVVRHLLPNVLAVMIVAASLNVGAIIITESILDFIGLGIQPPTASWGNMLTNAQTYFYHSAWLVVLPGALIFITVLAMNLFGNALRDAFDPRLKS
jgi:peptide/nickel transport system permease protein